MSATIWDEEVCNGLREEIFDSVRVRNPEGFMSHLDYEAITVRDPEREFKEEDMPCVSIYVRTHDFAKDRYYPVQNVISRDFENNTMVVEDASAPEFKVKEPPVTVVSVIIPPEAVTVPVSEIVTSLTVPEVTSKRPP